MRESRTYGSVRGAPSNGRPYRDPAFADHDDGDRVRTVPARTAVVALRREQADQEARGRDKQKQPERDFQPALRQCMREARAERRYIA